MDDYKVPNDEQIKALCLEVDAYARGRCEEEGFPWFYAFAVIEDLYEAMETYARLFDVLGAERMSALADAISKGEAAEVLEQAEKILMEES